MPVTTPPVRQHDSRYRSAQDMISGMSPNGRTAMADGLQAGIDLFGSTFPNKTLILLSDGLPNISLNSGSSQDVDFIKQQVIDLSTQAGQQGVCINTVGFGDPSMGADSIDEDFLTRVASASGCGKFYYATDAIELANVYVDYVIPPLVLFNSNKPDKYPRMNK